jgi:hypothetical protein
MAPRAEKITLCTEGVIAGSGPSLKIDDDKEITSPDEIFSSEKGNSDLWSDMN